MPNEMVDVAEYILGRSGEMTAMKLQKIVYYSQVWSLVWDEESLFKSEIQAWANGPVCPELYRLHCGKFKVTTVGGRTEEICGDARETIDAILDSYGGKTGLELCALVHSESPWRVARGRCRPGEPCSTEIKLNAMADYYGSLNYG